jgi:uncharacterized protein YbaP (TraB family)
MLKRIVSSFAAVSLLAVSAFADGPALWKVTDEDSEIWLFGTIHILKPETEWRSEKVTSAFNAADTIMFEAPTEETSPQEMQAIILPHIQNPDGVTLSSLISPEAYEGLKVAAAKVGVPEAALVNFEPLRPWFVALTLSVQQIVANGYNPESGVEKVLYGEAKAAGKEFAYLETIEQQIGFFGNMSTEQEIAMFEAGIPQLSEGVGLLDGMVASWSTGDVEGLEEKLNVGFDETPEMREALLVKRNRDWAAQIDEMMKGSGKIFIAVGSGHLAGEGSVQELLEAKGYKAVRQ